jgi:hypothetical protein
MHGVDQHVAGSGLGSGERIQRSPLAGRIRRRPERTPSESDDSRLLRDRLQLLDAELVAHAHSCGRLRLEMARGLEALALRNGHHEMGFSSVEAYALERMERSASWVQKSRRLARRLETLPELRAAHISGRVTWSMAAVLARVATPDDEASWLARADRLTVREVTALMEASRPESGAHVSALDSLDAAEPHRTLTITVPREDAWLFEGARLLAKHVGESTVAAACEAMLAEAAVTLCECLPAGSVDVDIDEDDFNSHSAQLAWEAELRRMRIASEELCESRMRAHGSGQLRAHESGQASLQSSHDAGGARDANEFDWSRACTSVLELDAKLRAIAAELATRDLAFGNSLEAFFRADGWRHLGYASAAHYARERLGTSLSSIKDKRQLARRLRRLPALVRAIQERDIGYEAARLVASVATSDTVGEWILRAKERTVRHLRQEIEAAGLAARLADESVVVAPSDERLRDVIDLERRIISGQIFPGADSAEPTESAGADTAAESSRPGARAATTPPTTIYTRAISTSVRARCAAVATSRRITCDSARRGVTTRMPTSRASAPGVICTASMEARSVRNRPQTRFTGSSAEPRTPSSTDGGELLPEPISRRVRTLVPFHTCRRRNTGQLAQGTCPHWSHALPLGIASHSASVVHDWSKLAAEIVWVPPSPSSVRLRPWSEVVYAFLLANRALLSTAAFLRRGSNGSDRRSRARVGMGQASGALRGLWSSARRIRMQRRQDGEHRRRQGLHPEERLHRWPGLQLRHLPLAV